jgi:hypothetical protein
MFQEVRSRYRKAAAYLEKVLSEPTSHRGFPALERLHLTEVRLWALAFPQQTILTAKKLLWDPAADRDDQNLALYALGILAREGNDPAILELAKVAHDAQGTLATRAIDTLARSGRMERQLPLMVQAAFGGNVLAIDALGYDGSIENVSRLKVMVNTLEKSVIPHHEWALIAAASALEQVEALQRPDWPKLVIEILSGSDDSHARWFPWALNVAEARKPEGAVVVLQDYLQGAETRELDSLRGLSNLTLAPPPDPETALVSSIDLASHQYYYDEVLLAYYKLGGQLSTRQRARLVYFGMIGDPLEALKVQLSRQSRWEE